MSVELGQAFERFNASYVIGDTELRQSFLSYLPPYSAGVDEVVVEVSLSPRPPIDVKRQILEGAIGATGFAGTVEGDPPFGVRLLTTAGRILWEVHTLDLSNVCAPSTKRG